MGTISGLGVAVPPLLVLPHGVQDRGQQPREPGKEAAFVVQLSGVCPCGHLNAEAVMMTAAELQVASTLAAAPFVASLARVPYSDHRATDRDLPLRAVPPAEEAIPKGPAPSYVPMAGYEPIEMPAGDATPWQQALDVIRSA